MVRHLPDESSATPSTPETQWVKGADGKWVMVEISAQQQAAGAIVVLQAPPHEMHGQCYGFEVARNGWAAPDCTFVSHATARPGYDTLDASEYLDKDKTLRAKVARLATLIRRATCCVVYAGAGLSTSAGIGDYATQARAGSLHSGESRLRSPMCAQPTEAHRVLAAMQAAGLIHRLIQQNHDGLPQKAGYPQHDINEIHGSLYAPDNPVVPMSGSLRKDLLEDVLACEARADLVLACGTSLGGMNADRIVHSCAGRASRDVGGSVIIGLQRTRHDGESTLRLFAACDAVFRLLAEELDIANQVPAARPRGIFFRPPVLQRHQQHRAGADEATSEAAGGEQAASGGGGGDILLSHIGYNAMGVKSATRRINLDLRQGATVVIPSGMHAGATGSVEGADREGHARVRFLLRLKPHKSGGVKAPVSMAVGTWWLQAAVDGAAARLPVVNEPGDDDESPAAQELRALRAAYGG